MAGITKLGRTDIVTGLYTACTTPFEKDPPASRRLCLQTFVPGLIPCVATVVQVEASLETWIVKCIAFRAYFQDVGLG
jgi:hypothetical protein